MNKMVWLAFGVLIAQSLAQSPNSINPNVINYDIRVTLFPEDHYLSGDVVIKNYEGDRIYLNPSLEVFAISRNGEKVPFHRNDFEIIIEGGRGDVNIRYGGKLLSEPVGTWLQRLKKEYRRCYINADSSFLMGEEAWYPQPKNCVDIAKITVEVPAEQTVITSGDLEKTETDGDRKIYSLNIKNPVPLISIAIGKYKESSYIDRNFEVFLYTLPDTNVNKEEIMKRSMDIIKFYSEKLTPYPYKRYSIVEASHYPGGHGDSQFITINFRSLGKDWETTMAHELAHQWFGYLICPQQHWQVEGFANFLASYWANDSPESLISYLEAEEPSIYEGVVANDTKMATLYYKSAAVIDMLRYVVGDDTFFKALREYILKYPLPSTPTDEDLQRTFETVYGKDLGWFFDEWLYEPGCPSYKIGDLTSSEGKVSFSIFQKGNFSMPLELKITTEKGYVLERVWVSDEMTPVAIDVDGKVLSVEIDPDNHILKLKA